MDSLNDIPYEVYIEYFLKYFTVKEIGSLTMTSKTLKIIFDSNEIWKKQHFKTTPIKIIDTSVYISSYEYRKIKISDKVIKSDRKLMIKELKHKFNNCDINFNIKKRCLQISEETIDLDNKPDIRLFIYNDLFKTSYYDKPPPGYELCEVPLKYFNERRDTIFSTHIHCCESVQSLYSLNIPGTIWYGYGVVRQPGTKNELYICNQPKSVQEAYIDYLKSEGITRSNISNHYIAETLDYQGVKVNYKSFKKMTLKKLFTKEKKKQNPLGKKVYKLKDKINNIDNQIILLEKQKKDLIKEWDFFVLYKNKQVSFCDKLEIAVKSI
jgi:hypothetical protein